MHVFVDRHMIVRSHSQRHFTAELRKAIGQYGNFFCLQNMRSGLWIVQFFFCCVTLSRDSNKLKSISAIEQSVDPNRDGMLDRVVNLCTM